MNTLLFCKNYIAEFPLGSGGTNCEDVMCDRLFTWGESRNILRVGLLFEPESVS